MANETPKFTLASASPRRRMLLEQEGLTFEVEPSRIVEPEPIGFLFPSAYASHLAWLKATEVGRRRTGWILAADTIASHQGEVLNKPIDRADAARILRTLSGTVHETITGLCLYHDRLAVSLVAVETTKVRMREIGDEELAAYLQTNRWEGKAGAYGIQDKDDPFVEAVEGSYSNVVGLPLERLRELLPLAARLTSPEAI
jgi:septum formation protein